MGRYFDFFLFISNCGDSEIELMISIYIHVDKIHIWVREWNMVNSQ